MRKVGLLMGTLLALLILSTALCAATVTGTRTQGQLDNVQCVVMQDGTAGLAVVDGAGASPGTMVGSSTVAADTPTPAKQTGTEETMTTTSPPTAKACGGMDISGANLKSAIYTADFTGTVTASRGSPSIHSDSGDTTVALAQGEGIYGAINTTWADPIPIWTSLDWTTLAGTDNAAAHARAITSTTTRVAAGTGGTGATPAPMAQMTGDAHTAPLRQ